MEMEYGPAFSVGNLLRRSSILVPAQGHGSTASHQLNLATETTNTSRRQVFRHDCSSACRRLSPALHRKPVLGPWPAALAVDSPCCIEGGSAETVARSVTECAPGIVGPQFLRWVLADLGGRMVSPPRSANLPANGTSGRLERFGDSPASSRLTVMSRVHLRTFQRPGRRDATSCQMLLSPILRVTAVGRSQIDRWVLGKSLP